MSRLTSWQAAKEALEAALENVKPENQVGAARALGQVVQRLDPNLPSTTRSAFKFKAEKSLSPFFPDGGAKPVTWAVMDVAQTHRRPKDRQVLDSTAGGGETATSMPLSDLYALLDGPGLEYDLRPYTARGRFTLLSASPKRGKSTFASLYARAKATGGSFLGQSLDPGTVLYVAPDENWRDVVRRFRSFGVPGESVHIWRGRDLSINRIAHRAEEIGAELVVLDTLLRVAGISDENDNAEWDRWFGEARDQIHDSGAVWLAVHHDRKSGGKDGEGIRGASAIFGSVDVAISLQSTEEADHRRTLKVEGTRLNHAAPLVIELNASEARYEAVGEVDVVSILEDSSLERLLEVLTPKPATVSSIYEMLRSRYPEAEDDVAESTVRSRLGKLTSAGLVRRSGEGGKRDPYRYSLSRSNGPNKTTERPGKGQETQGETRSTEGQDSAAGETRSVAQHPKGAERLSVEEEREEPSEDLQSDLEAMLEGDR